jgi:hypothetical protein
LRRRTLLVAAPVVVFYACASRAPESETSVPEAVGRADIVDVIYRPGATDEGILTLLNASVVDSPANEPVVTAPADAAALTTTTTFEYRVGTTAFGRAPRRRTRNWSLPAWLTLERNAFAHGAPMNGDAFFLVFSTSHAPKLLRVFTQDKSYVPSDDEWQRLAGAGETITLRIMRGIFEQGRLTTDGGPFASKPVHFSVAP